MNFLLAAVLAASFFTPPVRQAYGDGETLDYNLTWMKITGGTARMTIGPHEDGTLRITSVGKSTPGFSRIVKFRDEIESIVSADDFSTVRYTKKLDERGEKKEELTTIEDGVATRTRKKVRKVNVPRPVRDPISIIYFLRTLDMEPGKKHELDVLADGKLYKVQTKVLRREKVTTPAGTFNTVVVEPTMESGGKPREERLWIWYTDDERRLPVRIRSEVNFGAVTANLRGTTVGVSSIEPPALKESTSK